MRKLMLATAAMAAIALPVSVSTPAFAQTIAPNGAVLHASGQNLLTQVRWRHGWHRGWHRHGWGWAPALGAGIAGLAIGSALAAQPYAYYPGDAGPYGPSVAWCEQHYRSYDPGSQTYLGYDGYRHSCP